MAGQIQNICSGRKILPVLVSPSLLMSSCFEEDQRVPPHVPGDEISYGFKNSMYTHQAYFDLSSNQVQTENQNSEWLIRFGSMQRDNHIGINSADLWGVYPSGTTEEDSLPARIPVEEWIFDHSSGDPDSSAFAGWINIREEDTIYSNHIYLIGKYDGVGYRPQWAIHFLGLESETYSFRIRSWPSGEWKDRTILKSEFYNYMYYNASEDKLVPEIEPEKNSWDLLFTQYGSILFTDDGIPTPYYVRGVLLNRHTITVAVDSITPFREIDFELIEGYQYSRVQDIIGYEWKDVEVDQNSNTAVYTVRPDITFIIRDTEGFFHKMRFISFYNDKGEKGFPVIEHAKL